ncbi:MAG: hypothetical protein H7Y36_03230 [Armatimonadetes bacterium]|nr:hypothetical protein [Akkermansiaceae bacterium]
MFRYRFLPILIASVGISCSPSGDTGFIRRTTAAANDHIMLVRREPRTFGYQRLSALAQVYPDLGTFLQQQKVPDFLAETNKSGSRYLILYYLQSRKAYACRSAVTKSRQVEFSGPYPITNNEFKTLSKLRQKAEGQSGS